MTACRIDVLGAGAWGQALACHAFRLGHDVVLVARRPAAVLDGAGSSRRLPDLRWPPVPIAATTRAGVDFRLVAVPVAALRATVAALPDDVPSVLCGKGLEPGTGALPPEISAAARPRAPVAVLAGPNFAAGIAAGLPAAAIVAATDDALAASIADALGGRAFRCYASDDPIGAAVAGACKNVLAIAAGAAIGAGLGENARAAVTTRGLAEMARLVRALDGRTETAFGLAGIGDLLLTATGPASRNYRVGLALGEGRDSSIVTDGSGEVAEGVGAAPALRARAEAAGVEAPIVGAVADLVTGRHAVTALLDRLLRRNSRAEWR